MAFFVPGMISAAGKIEEEVLPAPNIVVFMADDMGMGDTSAYQDYTGNADAVQIHTPELEALARRGVRYTDAHSNSTACTASRYAFLTGRYSWRSRLKGLVAWGPQYDPLIERDRPTVAGFLRDAGYHTAMVGKWHLGLAYRNEAGERADGWSDADLRQPLFDGPTDHGFDYAYLTPRSHKSSAAVGWIEDRRIVGAKPDKRRSIEGFRMETTGARNYEVATAFLVEHFESEETREAPFFLWYAAHSNHAPHTPSAEVGGVAVSGQGKMKDGSRPPAEEVVKKKKVRGVRPNSFERVDFVYENDVAVGLLLNYLERTPDPRRPGKPLLDNTLFVFTSDNGSEKGGRESVGPFRGRKAKIQEGGHRIPFLLSWPAGGLGDGKVSTSGVTREGLFGLHDLYATFARILGRELSAGAAPDSENVLALLHGEEGAERSPLVLHGDLVRGPVLALRQGSWKLVVGRELVEEGELQPQELFDLAKNPLEGRPGNRLEDGEQRERLQRMSALLLAIFREEDFRSQ